MMYSSTSGGAGTMAENVSAGSVPMATATSILPEGRSPCGQHCASGGAGHDVDGSCRASPGWTGEGARPYTFSTTAARMWSR